MDFAAFGIGFWHPFGPHGQESPEQIIERKREEITVNTWTLWSFQYRRREGKRVRTQFGKICSRATPFVLNQKNGQCALAGGGQSDTMNCVSPWSLRPRIQR